MYIYLSVHKCTHFSFWNTWEQNFWVTGRNYIHLSRQYQSFQTGCINLHSHQQCVFSCTTSLMTLILPVLFIVVIFNCINFDGCTSGLFLHLICISLSIGHLVILFGEVPIQGHCQFFYWIFSYFSYWFVEFFIHSQYQPFVVIYIEKLSHSVLCFFIPLVSFDEQFLILIQSKLLVLSFRISDPVCF